MIEKNNLFAVTIWYNPSYENANNLISYINDVSHLIIVDNSDENNSALIPDFYKTKIIYIPNYKNIGVASALNLACKYAIKNNAEWILTMDQDSSFETSLFDFINLSNEFEEFESVGIFFPVHVEASKSNDKPIIQSKYTVINYAITSGNLLSLKYIEQVGFFMDDLFIDWIDEEICLKFTKLNLKIVRVNSAYLNHLVGKGTKCINFFGKTKYFDDYAPIRYYYITRNLFILCHLYPIEAQSLKRRWYKQLRKIVFYDNQHKFTKLYYLIVGLIHYFIGKKGSIDN